MIPAITFLGSVAWPGDRATTRRAVFAAILFTFLGSVARSGDRATTAATATRADSDLAKFVSSPADIVTLKSDEKLTVRPLALRPDSAPVKLVLAEDAAKTRLVASADIADIEWFESRYLKQLASLPSGVSELESLNRLHTQVRQLHFALRDCPPLRASPWQALDAALEDKGDEMRRALLLALCAGKPTEAEWRKADGLVASWLAGVRLESPLRADGRRFWIRRALEQCRLQDFAGAKATLERFERVFPNHAEADELRGKIQSRATALIEQAAAESAVAARQSLLEARALWPAAPAFAAAWKRIEPDANVLRLASPRLPTAFSPDSAVAPEDFIALDWLYLRWPQLLDSHPPADTQRTLKLRSDISWSDGRRLTADDARHSLREHMKSRAGKGLAEVLDEPRSEAGPFDITLSLRRGLFEPWRSLQIPVAARAAGAGVGCGPYLLDGKPTADAVSLRANPYFNGPARSFDAVHWTRWTGAAAKDPPHLVWDASPGDRESLLKAGYRDWRVLSPPRVWLIALNTQRPGLDNVDVRRALAHAVQRDKVLDAHFREGQKLHAAANGPFAPGSWGQAPAARVPASLDQISRAASFAKKAAETTKNVKLTLIFAKGDTRWQHALADIRQHMEDMLKAAGFDARIDAKELKPGEFRKALETSEFDMALTWVDRAEDVLPLAALSEGEPRLRQLFSQLLRHRQPSVVREQLHDFHAALIDRMPIIPLWRLDTPVAVHSNATIPPLDALHPFAK